VAFLVIVSSAFYSSFVREHKVLRYYANPLSSFYAIYKSAKKALVTEQREFIAIGKDATVPANDVDRELIVMVVGETVRADRFSLNGYERQTNPMLENHGVVSFTHASSCGTSTVVSVPCMFSNLTQHGFDDSRAKSMENLLDVLDHAGVKILWRDNNSNSKGVSDRVRTEDFRSAEINPICDTECRDEGMLAGLQDFIDQQPSGDVLIVLHQIGSHGPAYFKRYPPSFRKFKPTCDTNQLDTCTDEEISNTYDNTILYTDYFLSKVIALLAANDDEFETGMVFVGDHGESLGESGIYLHGLPFAIAPEEQTRIPLIMWFGKNYHGVGVNSVKYLKDDSFTHDNVFHSMLGLFEINSKVYDRDLDIMFAAGKLGS
jgi:lipid A ethanolaminephosphotransferase